MDTTNTVIIKFQLMYFYNVECLIDLKWMPKTISGNAYFYCIENVSYQDTTKIHEIEFCLLL